MPDPEYDIDVSGIYVSFLVRMWRQPIDPPASEDTIGWQGEIEQVQNGKRWGFHGLEQLIGFFEQWRDVH